MSGDEPFPDVSSARTKRARLIPGDAPKLSRVSIPGIGEKSAIRLRHERENPANYRGNRRYRPYRIAISTLPFFAPAARCRERGATRRCNG
jgi:hypothetical protein